MSDSSANAATEEPSLRVLLARMLEATMVKDKAAVLATFAPDAVFTDPHYPNPEMRGLDDIAAGLDWGFLGMERFGFTVVGSFMSEDGNSGAIEMDCQHVLASGRVLTFPQVFVAAMKDGLLVRVRAYEPYGPGGVAMFAIRVQNWLLRLRRKPAGGSRS